MIWTELVAHAKRRDAVEYFVSEQEALQKGRAEATSNNRLQAVAEDKEQHERNNWL